MTSLTEYICLSNKKKIFPGEFVFFLLCTNIIVFTTNNLYFVIEIPSF